MNQLPSNLPVGRAVDSRSLTRRLAQAPASGLPAVMQEARAAMAAANPEWISGRVVTLLSHYFRPDDPEHLAEAAIVDWIDALSIYPQWAIAGAVRTWNRTSNGKRPAPSHIAALCEAQTRPVVEEIAKAKSALARLEQGERKAPSPEQKARVAAMVARVTKRP